MLNLTTAIIASMVVMLVSAGVGVYLARYKPGMTEMLGMMLGMTQGMMTGIAVGYFIGAATDMFVSNLVGVIVGLAFGIVFGRVGGLMGMMDGGMGGAMGGMMGAMLGVMLQYLYNGWAITVTNVLIGAIYLVSMVALVRLVQQGAAAETEIDPVCDMKVDPKTSLQHVHQSRTYYFCAPSCQHAFAKSPETYLKK
ncbi:MAG: YHS domain-containing protein [Anaerolineales bacterium]|jgi:YHS domain-containing protein|nr:YHS domain-containing protein [Anaerolineales bacterium]